MALFRTTWFFKVNNYGWTENFHHMGSDYPTVRVACDALSAFRKSILGSNAQLVGVRISDDEVFRDSEFRQNPPIFGPGTWPTASDPAFTSLLTRWDSGQVIRKNLFLRGVPDELVEQGAWVNDPLWATRWSAFRGAVISNQFAIKSLGGPAAPQIAVLNIDATGIVSTGTPHSFIAGDKVHFSNVKTTPRLPTVMMVTLPITTFSFSLVNWAGRPAVFPTNGRVRKYVFQVVPITAGIWERVIKKSTGRPFDTPRGRRRLVK